MSDPAAEAAERVALLLAGGDGAGAAAALLAAAADERTWVRDRVLRAAHSLAGVRAVFPHLDAAIRDGADAARRNAARVVLAVLAAPEGAPGALRLLERLATTDADPDVRLIAASSLGETGNPRARAALEAVLPDADANVAAAAADALGNLGDPRSVEPLASLLTADPWRATAAVVALGRIGDPRALPALAGAARDPMLAAVAAEAIGELRDPDGLAALRPPAGSDDAEARRAALQGAAALLAAYPAPPEEWLREAARGELPEILQRFARDGDSPSALLLGVAGTAEAADALGDALADPDRAAPAAAGVGLLPAATALEVLLPRLEAPGAPEREELLAALPPLPDRASAERVAALLADPDEEVRAVAAVVLARAREEADVRELLVRRLADPATRAGAAQALGRLPGGGCDLLVDLLADPDAAVRRAAAEGIARCPVPEVRAAAASALERETDPQVKRSLVAALGAAGGAEAVPALAELTRGGESGLRFAAVRALGRTGDPGALAPLLDVLASGDAALEVAALAALGELGDARAAETVAERMEGGGREVRRAAASALRGLAPAGAAERLLRALGDSDWRVRVVAARTLGEVGAPEAVAALEAARDGDVDPLVRRAAARALEG
jgi:HEAT repeat protein